MTGEDGALSLSRETEFTLSPPFCLIQTLKGLGDATRIGEGDLLYSV